MRADLVFDMTGRPGERFPVIDPFYRGLEYRLLDLTYEDRAPVREHPLGAPMRLAANTMPEPELATAARHEIAFVADNPGDWMFHCHILEHQAAGMMGVRPTWSGARTR